METSVHYVTMRPNDETWMIRAIRGNATRAWFIVGTVRDGRFQFTHSDGQHQSSAKLDHEFCMAAINAGTNSDNRLFKSREEAEGYCDRLVEQAIELEAEQRADAGR